MPVRLEAVPAGATLPAPPRWLIWLLLYFCLTTISAVLTLLLWPQGVPASGARFWLILWGAPTFIWLLLFGARIHQYDEQINYAQLRNQLREDRLASETQRGQRAIGVIASVYETAMGNADLDTQLIHGGDGFRLVVPPGGTDAVRCTTLPDTLCARVDTESSVEALLEHLLTRLREALHAIPKKTAVHVRLQADVGMDGAELEAAWHQASRTLLPEVASLRLVEPSTGLLVLDQWLDAGESESSASALLAIGLQLRPTPYDDHGEAAAAVLCHLGRSRDGSRIADLHRPVALDESNLQPKFSEALLWGTQEAQSFDASWTSGIEPAFLNNMKSTINASHFGEARSEETLHFDLNAALGQTGFAAGWLALATAIERCCKEVAPQLIAAGENGHHRFLVISPVRG